MTLEEWRKRRVYGTRGAIDHEAGVYPVGYCYPDPECGPAFYFIADLGPAVTKRFHLVLGNQDWLSSNLEELEALLFEEWVAENA